MCIQGVYTVCMQIQLCACKVSTSLAVQTKNMTLKVFDQSISSQFGSRVSAANSSASSLLGLLTRRYTSASAVSEAGASGDGRIQTSKRRTPSTRTREDRKMTKGKRLKGEPIAELVGFMPKREDLLLSAH